MDVIVIGGGAAGFFGAIACAEANPNANVLLLEKGRNLLAKVRISGGGRCNVTHACFDPVLLVENYPRGASELRGPFTRFQPKDTVEWFVRRGVDLKTEPDGRMFPVTNQSSTVIDCLRQAADRAGVRLRTQTHIQSVARQASGFFLILKDGETLVADRVLLATGSDREGYRWAETLGHSLRPPVPSLFTLMVRDPRLEGLAGLSVKSAHAELVGSRLVQKGPVLITHWGLSGPAILRLSAWGARALYECGYQAALRINWLADVSAERLEIELARAVSVLAKKSVRAQNPFRELPLRLWQRCVGTAQIPATRSWADLSRAQRTQLALALQGGVYAVTGKGVFKEEFVTCGGVKCDEVNFKTMESRRCPGLYLAGEILDIDGITGGFNFQNAWTTGWLAGQAMGKE